MCTKTQGLSPKMVWTSDTLQIEGGKLEPVCTHRIAYFVYTVVQLEVAWFCFELRRILRSSTSLARRQRWPPYLVTG